MFLQVRLTARGHAASQKNSHEAEGAVGDEEEFLAAAGQAVQHGVGLVPSDDELLWGGKRGNETGSAPPPDIYITIWNKRPSGTPRLSGIPPPLRGVHYSCKCEA